jgi:hypothetical protein
MSENHKTRKQEAASDIKLVPFADFKNAAKKILSNTKKESDAELVAFHASNVKKRSKKKG